MDRDADLPDGRMRRVQFEAATHMLGLETTVTIFPNKQ